jgi:hypothetical protein
MADQADNLRQLVRARREWRQLVVEGQSASAAGPRSTWTRPLGAGVGEKASRPPAGARKVGVWVVQAARWALGRVIR